MQTVHGRGPIFLPLIFALLGLVFASWNVWDASSVPCLTNGCTLYKNYTLGGISLWWVGIVFFGILAFVAALGLTLLGKTICGIGLTLDCFLLIIMGLTLPCLSCMLAALLMALCYLTFRQPLATGNVPKTPRRFSLLLACWSLLFILNIWGAVRSEFQPWSVNEPTETANIRIFFSPSCSACRELVLNMSIFDADKVIWAPVAEDDQDLAVILDLKQRMQNHVSISSAFAEALEAKPLNFMDHFNPEVILLQLRLWRNQMQIIESGQGKLPFVEFRGLPQALLKPKANAQSSVNYSDKLDPTLPLNLDQAGACGGSTTLNGAPCP